MKNRLILAFGLTLGLLGSNLSALDFTEGNWEVKIDTEITALDMHLPTITSEQCMTKEHAIPQQEMQDDDCTMAKPKVSGSTITWSFICSDSQGTGKIVYKGKTFTSNINITSESGEMKMKIKGKYKGVCKE